MTDRVIKQESPDGHIFKTGSPEGPVLKEDSPGGPVFKRETSEGLGRDLVRPERPSARQQDARSLRHDIRPVTHERWEPREEPRNDRSPGARSGRDGRRQDYEASGHRYQGAAYEPRNHRYQGDDHERRVHHYQGDDYERRSYRYQGDDHERHIHSYQGDDHERRIHSYQGDDYEHRGRRYEHESERQLVRTKVNLPRERSPRRRPSPPRYWDPYEDDYAWRERSPRRWPSPPRYRDRPDDNHRRGPTPYEGDGYARGRRGYRGYGPTPPPVPSPVPLRTQRPVPPPPPAPAPPRAPQPQVSGNRVWLTPKPKPPHVGALPRDRNLIHCENCNRQHDPRLCRGPVSNGRINVCARCGSKRHLFEECWFGDPAVDDVDYFLWHPRQGLAPISTRIDLSDRVAIPGHHVRPVYSRKFAQEQYTREKTEKMRLGLLYLEKTIDYGSLQAPEFECMNTPLDPSLVGYTRGPPASRNPKHGHA
ncbi:hypothetical protein DL769_006263 [Monosporascus sp. CRB-8-3]|nr:hypothetical protein DL769_006263 [Monosporascus sp. CRB-8-3]